MPDAVAARSAQYTIHGLRVQVEGPLAATVEPSAAGPADIIVRVQNRPDWADAALDPAKVLFRAGAGDDSSALQDAGPVQGGNGTRIRFAEGATFWIAASLDEVWLEYEPPLTDADAAYFLFEPVLAFVLRARGVLAMHASAVEIAGRAVVFCGPAGSGKSIAAGACVRAGAARLLSDDIVALSVRDEAWIAHRGTRTIRLWDDGARVLGHDAERLARLSPTWEKRVMALTGADRSTSLVAPVGLVCVLGDAAPPGAPPTLEPLRGAAAFQALVAHTASNRLHDDSRRATEVAQLAKLGSEVSVMQLAGSSDGTRPGELVGAVLAAIGG